MTISIVVPVHNEAENIDSLLNEITTALTDFPAYEIIYIDDGSTDNTLAVLKKPNKLYPICAFFITKKVADKVRRFTRASKRQNSP